MVLIPVSQTLRCQWRSKVVKLCGIKDTVESDSSVLRTPIQSWYRHSFWSFKFRPNWELMKLVLHKTRSYQTLSPKDNTDLKFDGIEEGFLQKIKQRSWLLLRNIFASIPCCPIYFAPGRVEELSDLHPILHLVLQCKSAYSSNRQGQNS